MQTGKNGKKGAVVFHPRNSGKTKKFSWMCVDPVNRYKDIAKSLSGLTGKCRAGRKLMRFSYQYALRNVAHTIRIRPRKSSPVIAFKSDTKGKPSARSRTRNRVPTKPKKPKLRNRNKKTAGIKMCGGRYYYIDRQFLRENSHKGCSNRRYGGAFGYTVSKTPPNVKSKYIVELYTVCNLGGFGKTKIISRGRKILRHKVSPQKYTWGEYIQRRGKKIACKQYRYNPKQAAKK